jgi:uncharacterized membrane protein
MERMIQALFENEVEAFKGLQALQQLDLSQDISIGETYVLTKDFNGQTSIRSAKDDGQGAGALGGGLLGGLIGLLAGPLGLIVGVAGGMIAGSAGETLKAENVSDYLDAVSEKIPNGKSVLIAHVWEDWETPVNTVLLPISSQLSRFDLHDEVYIPAKTELDKVNEDIKVAETKFLEAEGEEKGEWNATLTELRSKRNHLQQELDRNYDKQEDQYKTWIDRYNESPAEHDADRKEFLEKRITEQRSRLDQLKKNR